MIFALPNYRLGNGAVLSPSAPSTVKQRPAVDAAGHLSSAFPAENWFWTRSAARLKRTGFAREAPAQPGSTGVCCKPMSRECGTAQTANYGKRSIGPMDLKRKIQL